MAKEKKDTFADDPCKALKKHTALEAVKRYEEYKKETASERPQRNKKAV